MSGEVEHPVRTSPAKQNETRENDGKAALSPCLLFATGLALRRPCGEVGPL